MPANPTCALATVITALPLDVTQAREGAAELWWTYTTGPTEQLLSLLVTSNGTHAMTFGDGSCAVFNDFLVATDQVRIVPVTPNTQYFLLVDTFSVGATQIRVRIEGPPTEALVADALVIPTVFNQFLFVDRATVYHPQTGAILQVIPDFPKGNAGDSLGDVALNQDFYDVVLFDVNLVEIGRYVDFYYLNTTPGPIFANPTTRSFWVATPITALAAEIYKTSDALVVDPQVWHLTTGSILNGIAVSADETILYWTENNANTAVHRHNLLTDTPLSDLTPLAGAGWTYLRTMVRLSDESIVVGTRRSAPNSGRLNRYSPAGVLLATYNVDTQDDPSFILDAMARSLVNLDGVWVWTEKPGGSLEIPPVPMHMRLVQMTDVSIVEAWDFHDAENGVGIDTIPEPRPMWGPDTTAIFWPLTVASPFGVPACPVSNLDPRPVTGLDGCAPSL